MYIYPRKGTIVIRNRLPQLPVLRRSEAKKREKLDFKYNFFPLISDICSYKSPKSFISEADEVKAT